MRIELVGGLGVGKSTLCNALDAAGVHKIYETIADNPFLSDCFADPLSYGFPSQMWFAISKFHEIRKFVLPGRVNVLDQSVLNVRAYTNLFFKGREDDRAFRLIAESFSYLEEELGRPDLLVALTCSPVTQLRRIRGRNRAHEAGVTLDYIETLQAEIDALLNMAESDGIGVLRIDTEEIYLPGNFTFAADLADRIFSGAGLSGAGAASIPGRLF